MATLSSKTGLPSFLSTNGSSGEKNYITNPSMLLVTTGWNAVGDFTLSRSTTAAELPREYTTATGIKVIATSGTQSTADYIYFDFTLDDVDLSKNLKIQWSQKQTGSYVASNLAVVITSQADRTTALHTPQTTNIPAADGVFTTSFDAGTTATLSLVIRATTDMATNAGLVISDVIVGPGVVQQVSGPGEYTYTTSGITSSGGGAVTVGTGGSATDTMKWRRVGSAMEVQLHFTFGTSGASFGTGSYYKLNLPTGYTLITTGLPSAAIGVARLYDSSASTFYDATITYNGVGSTFLVLSPLDGTNIDMGPTSPFTFAASDAISASFTVPIAEWAGQALNLGAGAQVEYAYNSSTSTTTADTTSFAYGPGGAQIKAITAWIQRRVRFQYPIQSTDKIEIQVSPDQSQWFPVSGFSTGGSNYPLSDFTFNYNGTAFQGIGYKVVSGSTTDIDVHFGVYSTSYNSTNVAWSSASADVLYWRVCKAKPSSPVGFGLAGYQTSGLINYYYEYDHTTTWTFNGSGGTSSTNTIKITRIGRQVTLTCNDATVTATTGTSSSNFTMNTALPSWARPAVTTYSYNLLGINNGSSLTAACLFEISSAGVIILIRDGAATAWSNSATCGMRAFTVSYSV